MCQRRCCWMIPTVSSLPASSQRAHCVNMGGMQQVKKMYLDELHFSADSAFVTHGLCTFLVLVFGWASCCFAIDILANNIESVRRSKIQPSRKTDDPELRKLAKQVVIRNWVTVLLQAVLGAPLLKAAFPSYKKETALGWSEFSYFSCAGLLVMIFCSQYSIECFMSLHFCIDLCTRNTTHGKHHLHGCLTQCLCMKCQQMALHPLFGCSSIR